MLLAGGGVAFGVSGDRVDAGADVVFQEWAYHREEQLRPGAGSQTTSLDAQCICPKDRTVSMAEL